MTMRCIDSCSVHGTFDDPNVCALNALMTDKLRDAFAVHQPIPYQAHNH